MASLLAGGQFRQNLQIDSRLRTQKSIQIEGVRHDDFLLKVPRLEAVYMCGLIPAFIGLALLVYVFFMAKPVA
jgi:hypothetical protein